MGGVERDRIDGLVEEGFDTLLEIRTDADSRGAPQPACGIARCIGELLALEDVFHRDQADQAVLRVDQRQLLDAVLLQDRFGLLERRALAGRDETARRHELRDRTVEVGARAEPCVAVGEDADQPPVGIGDRHAAELEAVHQRLGVVQSRGRRQRDRVGDHSALAALDLLHFRGLILDRQVAMDHTDATLAGGGDGHACFRDLVHRCRDDRDVEGDVGCERGRGVDRVGKYVAVAGDDDDIVEGEGFESIEEFVCAHAFAPVVHKVARVSTSRRCSTPCTRLVRLSRVSDGWMETVAVANTGPSSTPSLGTRWTMTPV